MRPRTLDEFVGQEAEIKTQVSRHREAQLAAQIEGIGVTSIEMLTYGTEFVLSGQTMVLRMLKLQIIINRRKSWLISQLIDPLPVLVRC